MTTIPTSPSFSLTSSTMATTFTLMSQVEGTWSPGKLANKMAAPLVAQLAPACRSSRSSACNVGNRIGAAGATR